jgi:hypothetical protein
VNPNPLVTQTQYNVPPLPPSPPLQSMMPQPDPAAAGYAPPAGLGGYSIPPNGQYYPPAMPAAPVEPAPALMAPYSPGAMAPQAPSVSEHYTPAPYSMPAAPEQPWTPPAAVEPPPAMSPPWSTPVPSMEGYGQGDPGPHTIADLSQQIGEDMSGRRIIRIPVRLGPGEQTDITEQDIILHEGDIVFIESRETEVFYTGGLLGGGQYTLPRDYDLDVLGAIAVAQGQRAGGAGGSRATQSALNADVSISASQLIILRPLADGTQLTLQVDLYEAVRNPNERIIVQPGDYLMLQYTRAEAMMAFIERHLFEGALFGVAAAQLNQGGGN